MKHLITIFALVISLFASNLNAATYHVRTSGSDANNGTSWATAFATLQKALEEAESGDEIWVAEGIYYPTKDISGDDDPSDPRMKTFQMVENVKIYGGFSATGTPVFADRNWETHVTTLSGDLGDDGYCYNIFYLDNGLGLTRDALLDGFTVTNGVADNFSEGFDDRAYGGAMYIENNSPTIRNCRFVDNFAQESGGAIYVTTIPEGFSNPLIENCNFINNGTFVYEEDDEQYTYTGGAIAIYNAETEISECTFEENYAEYGGAIDIYDFANVTITDCTFENNGFIDIDEYSFTEFGGAITLYESELELTDSEFSSNRALAGGAIFHLESELLIVGCTFQSNTAYMNGGAISDNAMFFFGFYPDEISYVIIDNSEFFSNSINPILIEEELDGGGEGPIFFFFMFGGGAISNFSYMDIRSCIFEDNEADYFYQSEGGDLGGDEFFALTGGAILNFGELYIVNSLLNNNLSNFGGAISLNNFFSGFNEGGDQGEGVEFIAYLDITNTTIADNNAKQIGGGIFAFSPFEGEGDSELAIDIYNSIIWGNTAVGWDFGNEFFEYGHQFYLIGSDISLYNSCFADGDDDIVLDFGSSLNDTDCINDNPLFVGEGDYTLQDLSPAINAGDDFYVPEYLDYDLAGDDRIQDGTVDMGCYEGTVPLIVIIDVEPREACANEEEVFLISPTDVVEIQQGSGDYTYSWSPSFLVDHPDPTSPVASLIRVIRSATYTLTVLDNETGRRGKAEVSVEASPWVELPSLIVHRFHAEDIEEPLNLYELVFGVDESGVNAYMNNLIYGEGEGDEIPLQPFTYCVRFIDRFTGDYFQNPSEYIPNPNSRQYLWVEVKQEGLQPPPNGDNDICYGCLVAKRRLNIVVRGNELGFVPEQ